MVPVSPEIAEINEMEQIYLKEYYALVDKDKADGKDFNKLREQSMMVQQYHFEYQRQLVKEKE